MRLREEQNRMATHEYSLYLSDGSSWRITGDEFSARWIDKLATIMELKESASNGSPKLVFCKKGHLNGVVDNVTDSVPSKSRCSSDNGWNFYDHDTLHIWYHNDIPDVICEMNNNEGHEIQIVNMWHSLQPIYQQSISRGGLSLHAGLAELDGRGVLLVGASDKGKSTCCRRLPDYWKPLCDDEALVVLDEHKKYRTHPFPTWSDHLWNRSEKTWDVQSSVALCGVFFLEQAEVDEVVPVGEGQASIHMSESAMQICQKFWRTLDGKGQRQFRTELFNNACKMAKQIPAYRLRVSLHGRFWEKMEQVVGQ
jgi:SynChlorMet cassette protein ScmC